MRFVTGALLAAGAAGLAGADELLGFDAASSESQRALEARFDEQLSADRQRDWLQRLSARPHHVGSAAGEENARYIAGLLESWGYDVEIAEYEILLPTPVTRELELVEPGRYTATLEEDTLAEDPGTGVRDELLPPYNAFSVGGEVEGELVFVNYGIPEDYEVLERHGVDVAGKIAIAKYGRSWRGIKPKLAAEKGAIATIIYSDPADDGYARGDAYPEGPFKHESGVQRGSVMDMPTYPGDVLTPGEGATPRAERLAIDEAPTLTAIPVLPISQRDALPLLEAMQGAVVPEEWRGALPITYHLGPGPARVRMKLEFSWDMVTAYNVIARLEGSDSPEQWVIRGNHHDGWNAGAADPNSGLVSMLAEARAVAALADAGHPPARTIIYAAWDAEEPGLIGSTEWAEHHAAELREHAVAYLNTDGNSRGFIGIGGSHTLERFFNEIMADVTDPQTGATLKARRRAALTVEAEGADAKAEAAREDLRLYPLGSGSDYTPFLQHLGIASANMSFGGEGEGGSYHTLYDTFEHYTTWRDPGLRYGVALSMVTGRATLRLANAPLLPFEFEGFADNVATYVSELETLAESMRKSTAIRNEWLDQGLFELALDPTASLGPPARQDPVPHFNFAPLKNALERLQKAAAGYSAALQDGAAPSRTINELLYTSERLLTRDEGLTGRPWYKHHVYAPGFYTGYGVKTLPGVREAIEQRAYDQVALQVEIAASVLERIAERIETLTGLLAG
ncbi:MAG: transferrin receptor-like dimerization domain-containing protein [Woeseiaceae bacterium]|nr:transferrin receptor-like dimerization domain-containing protein [Woeseiaceae bacterium]